jgi:RNA polymerase sigma-70 factor, ECF subfamily
MSAFALTTAMAAFGPMDRLGPDRIEIAAPFADRSAPSTLRPLRAPAANGDLIMPLANRTDESLMTAYLAGDRGAFVELVERYRTELHQFLTRFLGSSAAADDIFQETFLQVHVAGHSYDQERAFKPWLFTIAANKARDWHRRQKRRAAVSLDAPLGQDQDGARLVDLMQADAEAPNAPAEAGELKEMVADALKALPAHYREILLLSYFQRMSYQQVAEVLDIPLGTVKSRLHAAVAAFADRWKTTRANAHHPPFQLPRDETR